MSQPRPRALRALLALAPIVLALQGCSMDLFGPSSPADDLRAARRLWERQGIASYRYTFYRSCGECLPEAAAPARVEVRDGRTVSVVAAGGRPIRPEFFDGVDTVEEIFAGLEEVIARGPYRFSARYDERRGYAVSHSVDLDRKYVDDEGGFTVADFEVIQ
jgi:hypothetical protein